MYTALDEINLVSDLLYVLGLNVNKTNNVLLDQETGEQILFEGKNIKATRKPNSPAYISENDIKLEPANPKCTKLMNRLFGFFLDKESEFGNIPKTISYYFEKEDVNDEDSKAVDSYFGPVKLVIKYSDGTTFESNAYKSKALVYTDAILGIDGSFDNERLKIFDIEDEK